MHMRATEDDPFVAKRLGGTGNSPQSHCPVPLPLFAHGSHQKLCAPAAVFEPEEALARQVGHDGIEIGLGHAVAARLALFGIQSADATVRPTKAPAPP